MKRNQFPFILSFLIGILIGCTSVGNNSTKIIPINPLDLVTQLNYTLECTFPHDITLFTEGLVIYNNQLFESTGSPREIKLAKSIFGIIDLKTGKISIKGELNKKYFGEGIVFFNNKLYQLTYKDKIGFIYDAKTFQRLGVFNFQNDEGWGLTTDGTNIIMSDGTNILTYFDPNNMKVIKTLTVTCYGKAVNYINELEYISGYIYANIWMTNYIVKINPKNGKIVGKIDLTSLSNEVKNAYPNADVMNGIAYDSLSDKVYITGKLWPYIFQIKMSN
jgi:glutamine cyclotransferase